jgi:hypothetical protein
VYDWVPRTLAEPSSDRTRIEREFDPGAIRRLRPSRTATSPLPA